MTKPLRRRNGATIPDVARAAGVSRSTTARALGGYGAVAPETLARVRAAAEELGYRPNELARSMITGKTFTIGAVVADIENPFFARVTRGISDAARSAGFEVVLVNTDEDIRIERTALKVLLDKQVDGVVVAPASSRDADHLRSARECGARITLIDRRVAGLDADAVLIDNRTAARDAVRRLLAAGHRRIALVTGGDEGPSESPRPLRLLSTGTERIEGYRAALEAAGVPDCAKYLRTSAFGQAQAERLTAELLALDAPPTALFASDLLVALGALRAVRAAGLTIPTDLAFVAFDDADWTTLVTPPLSVVAQPAYDMGVKAAEVLIERIQGDDAPPREHLLPTTFVERDSVAAPAAMV
jgi:LacI family transcriptional regulator